MKTVFIGTYPPRECGIGTFTQNLFKSMTGAFKKENERESGQDESFIVAMNDFEYNYAYPEEVKLTIRQELQEDYLAAVKYINLSGADCCILEHEFGIYGGQSGVYILPLLHRLEIPLVVTLHTILKTPSYNEKAILQEICKMANRVVVMSRKGIELLINVYEVPEEKIAYIEHGVPDFIFTQEETKKEFKLENKKLLLTFGFISRNKGIETVIKALPKVVEKYPNVLYMVLGKTHPNVLRFSGDEYRSFLNRLIKDLNLEKHVVLINKFVSQKELFKYLHASDIYITPYLNEAQITSGTLSFAVGAGSAVVSTPYWHASELLADGKGVLFDFNNSDELSGVLIELFDKPEKRLKMRKKAYDYGREITHSKTGDKYNTLLEEVVTENFKAEKKEEIPFDLMLLPPFSLAHIKRMTDDTGIIQHAKYGIPNLKEGYCLDDNARALLMALMVFKQMKDYSALELCPIYLSYIDYMQNKDGTFKNFLSFNRNFLDETGSEDSFGRTIWALGYMLANAPNDSYYQTSKLIFSNAVPAFEKLKSIRSIANTIIGICYYIRSNPSDDVMIEILRKQTYILIGHYDKNSSDDWKWFEELLAYDNAILPLSLLHAAEILSDDKVREVAVESMDFLSGLTLSEGYLSIIGNDKWHKIKEERSKYAQQPLDAMAMVLMYHQAFRLTKDKEYLKKLFTSFMWFLGENDLRMSLFDFETNGCCDGLESYGVNRNQGAESTLAYLISYLTVLHTYDTYYSKN
ncbi:MAG: glycosyltransferase family 4 protein [Ignavibacteria bacterium]|nr:glycosyltransferase family 4 protein [Ignavibacteria bacterium]